MNEPLKIIPAKTDAEIAEELKRDLLKVYEPLLAILERGRVAGFICNIQVGAAGPHAPIAIQSLQIMKQF